MVAVAPLSFIAPYVEKNRGNNIIFCLILCISLKELLLC